MTKFDLDTLRSFCKSIFDHWRKAAKTDTNKIIKYLDIGWVGLGGEWWLAHLADLASFGQGKPKVKFKGGIVR